MNIVETIKRRKSCRAFNHEVLTPADKNELGDFILENKKSLTNEVVNFGIIEKEVEVQRMKIDYGMIKGHTTYIVGTSKPTMASRVNYGYMMEKVVLKATEMNISTCWIGYFDSTYFKELFVEDGYEIPCIVIIGYAKDRQTYQDKLIRFSMNASKRHNWDKLFFNYPSKTPLTPGAMKEYADSLEGVRLAPSSGNTQPWRVFFDDAMKEFHFYKKIMNKQYELRGLQDIDMGIALAHFELISLQNGLSGSWLNLAKEQVDAIDDLQYIMTWKCE